MDLQQNLRAVGFACAICLLSINLKGQSTSCVDPANNANGDPWSEQCYLNSTCGVQGNPCQANDVNLLGVFVADVDGLSLEGCSNPNPVNGYIWGNFTNGTGTDRYAIQIYTEVLINGVFETTLNTCAFDTLASGVNQDAFLVGPVIWTCGDQLTLQNTWIAWDTNGSTCATSTDCSHYPPAKCFTNWEDPPINILTPNFSIACGIADSILCFTDLTSGGTPPYTYEWSFNAGPTASTIPSPCAVFEPPFTDDTFKMTVTDNLGVSASIETPGSSLTCVNLPLDLIHFESNSVDGIHNELVWTTTNEVGFSHFEIERSGQSILFEKIGSVSEPNSFQNNFKNYRYIDDAPLNGTNLYRLKMIDNNGSYEYSPVTVSRITLDNDYIIQPNPANNIISLMGFNGIPAESLHIYNVYGQQLKLPILINSNSEFRISVESLQNGVYYITDHQSVNLSFIKH